MKKILALTSLIFALSVGATAMAADYEATNDKINGVTHTTALANGYETVLVQASNDDIVYVDQADSVFGASLNLMLKAGIDDGTYTMKFGGAGQTLKEVELELTTAGGGSTTDTVVADMTTAATTNNGDGTTNVAFSANVNTDVDAVEFTVTKTETGQNKTGVLDLKSCPTISGGTTVECAVLVSNIPEGYTVTAKLVKKATSNG